jgi:DNA-binding LytR/AlgR family response regulator
LRTRKHAGRGRNFGEEEHVKINIELDKALEEIEVLIRAAKMTEEVNGILKKLEEPSVQMISGFAGDTLEILEQADIIRVYAAKGKVYAVTAKGEYLLRMRLYEAEERLDQTRFVRISNSEINLKMAKRFDLSFSGTICVNLAGGQTAYVSRRYVAKIKRLLGI